MKFRNPWIDPRIAQVTPEQARAYLLRRGWRFLGPTDNPMLEMFAGPVTPDGETVLLLPL